MKALVTGGAGCIGSELAATLLQRGWEVTVVDNLSTGRMEHIQGLLSHRHFRFIEGNILEPATISACMAETDCVFHMAANSDVKYVLGDPTDVELRENTLATYSVLEAMRAKGVRRLAFASTSAIYGISAIQPIPEDAPPRPISLYGATKLGAEAIISAFSNLFNIQCWIFRFANVVGGKVRKTGRTVISDFIYALERNPKQLTILGDGRQAKSYLWSGECIEAMLYIMEHATDTLNIYNIGCHDSISVTRIAEMVVEAMRLSEVQYSYTGGEGGWLGDVPRFILDASALNRLGWRAQYSSSQAVAMAIQEVLRTKRAASSSPEASPCRP